MRFKLTVLANPTVLPTPIWSLQAYEQDLGKFVRNRGILFLAP